MAIDISTGADETVALANHLELSESCRLGTYSGGLGSHSETETVHGAETSSGMAKRSLIYELTSFPLHSSSSSEL